MNKRLISLILVFLAIFVTTSYAWNWDTHQAIADKLYGDMPRELQVKLNLTLMEEGSIAPDKVFHNNILHHYPTNYPLILERLNNGSNWDEISYNFGIVTHYISDSFSAPHYIIKEPADLHTQFEKQVKDYIPRTNCQDYNLDLKMDLIKSSLNHQDWGEWLLSKDKSIPEKEVDDSMKLVYSVAFDKFNFTCNKKADVEYVKEYFSWTGFLEFIEFIGSILLLYIVYRTIKRFKYKN